MQILAKSTVKIPPWIHNRNKKCLLISKFPGVCSMSAAPVKSRNVKPCDSSWTPTPISSFTGTGFEIIQSVSLHLVTLSATDAILWISSPLYTFNSLVPAVIWLLQQYEPGLPCFLGNIWGTRFHLVFVWSSKYLGEAEDSFHLKCVFTSLKQWGSEWERDWKTACHFLSSLSFGLLLTQRVCACTLTPLGCSFTPGLPCKIQFICSKQWLKHCL